MVVVASNRVEKGRRRRRRRRRRKKEERSVRVCVCVEDGGWKRYQWTSSVVTRTNRKELSPPLFFSPCACAQMIWRREKEGMGGGGGKGMAPNNGSRD